LADLLDKDFSYDFVVKNTKKSIERIDQEQQENNRKYQELIKSLYSKYKDAINRYSKAVKEASDRGQTQYHYEQNSGRDKTREYYDVLTSYFSGMGFNIEAYGHLDECSHTMQIEDVLISWCLDE
jgi:hypothetical protein